MRTFRRLAALLVAGALPLSTCVHLTAAAHAVLPSRQAAEQTFLRSGQVTNGEGSPVGAAEVVAEPVNSTSTLKARTDPAGNFILVFSKPGRYTVQASAHGLQSSRLSYAVTQGSQQALRLVLGTGSTTSTPGTAHPENLRAPMEFNDTATFTVAGVTDWTAVGGHGSDATLKASEDLNRRTATLPSTASAGRQESNAASEGMEAARSDGGESHRLAGELAERSGHPLTAVQEFQRAVQSDPSEANYFAWGTELLEHRASWAAAQVFARAATAYPSSSRLVTAWGAALFAAGRYSEASEKLCAASDMDPAAREPYLFAGEVAMAAPPTTPCVRQTLERFLASRPDDAQANYLYAKLLLKEGAEKNGTRAERLLLHAVALDPACSDGYLQLGILKTSHMEYTDAIAFFKQAVTTDAGISEAHYRLGVLYDRLGEHASAVNEYKLHEQLKLASAARVEQQRRDVKQFSVAADFAPTK